MALESHILASTKEAKYEELIPQIEGLVSEETDLIANLSNVMAVLKEGMKFFWVGCYLVKEKELVLGPFQGTVACTRIQKGKGVCGDSWAKKEIIIVGDVNAYSGHIACSSAAQSEIVLPVFNSKKEVIMVLDVDSNQQNDFDKIDEKYLQKVTQIIERKF